jgi:uncharacterized protein YgiM (DUF1202 family)
MKRYVFYMLLAILVVAFPVLASADTPSPLPYTTNANVRLRTQPTTDAEIVMLVQNGTTVWVVDLRDNDWFSVEVDGKKGYMKGEFLTPQQQPAPVAEPEPEPAPIPEPVIEPEPILVPVSIPEPVMELTPAVLPVSFPVIEAEPVLVLFPEPEPVAYIQPVLVPMPETISETYITPPPAVGASFPKKYITTANVNLRRSPGTDGTRLATVPRGRTVNVTDFGDGEWYAVDFNGNKGYMIAEFLVDEASAPDMLSGIQYADTGIGTVELVPWKDVKNGIFKQGSTVQIIDVRTRITYRVKNFSNGNHADVDPLTADDTTALKQTFNNRWSWNPRPILVVIGDRYLAASINGMPHGGSNISGNNVNGHFCIHFKDSRTHNGTRVHERDHQNAVNEAFRTASGW